MSYPGLTEEWDEVLFPQKARIVVNNLLNGKLNCTGTFTVTNGTTSTVVDDSKCTGDSVILWMALDAASADTSTFYVSARTKGQFTITHNNSGSNRSYAYILIG